LVNISSFGKISSGRFRLPSITKTRPGKLSKLLVGQKHCPIRCHSPAGNRFTLDTRFERRALE
jgi:hypothetical protein